jgi:hypothetical protein
MGFLDHSTNNIILDAVLTDLGRRALARNDGSFEIFKFAFSDEEVDYGNIVQFGRTVGKERIEKITPILEAVTQGNQAQKYRCMSINNDALTRLPTLALTTTLTNNILSLARSNSGSNTATNQFLQVKQYLSSGVLDTALIDFSYRVTCDYTFIGMANRTPDSIDAQNLAVYTIPANPAVDAQNLSTLSMTLFARNVSNDLISTYKQKGGSVVEKIVTISGMNSGASMTFRVQIS